MSDMVKLVEDTAQGRGDTPVPREYIERALEEINQGKHAVKTYPTGAPTLTAVYAVAVMLYAKTQPKH
ncbi:MAG TPA: hypothetical protein VHD55_00580 [Candidatus Paceibacterota bacterium]|nr:hypothetical protein [Candidatus Paceibacterota bacterium]